MRVAGKRRLATVAATVVAAGLLAVVAPSPAQAAPGEVWLDEDSSGDWDTFYQNPSGCYNDTNEYVARVANRTNDNVFTFASRDCNSDVFDTIPPGGEVQAPPVPGWSFLVF